MVPLLGRPDAVWVWESERVRTSLAWYREVMRDVLPSRHMIARCTPAAEKGMPSMEDRDLWDIHERTRATFLENLRSVRSRSLDVERMHQPTVSFLDIKRMLARRIIRACRMCERRCGVDRTLPGGRRGTCGLSAGARVCSAFPHMGEEAPLIGETMGGSGTIFFASCTFRCVFCQNYDISHEPHAGRPTDARRLASLMDSLRRGGCANINLVGGDPVPNTHVILDALAMTTTNFPLVWNTNMYGSEENMELMSDLVDLWLPDFKYGNDECASRLSGVRRYTEVVSRNHLVAYASGEMVVRHLVLPGHVECCSIPLLRFIAERMPGTFVNIMDQYHPDNLVVERPEAYPRIARRVSLKEMKAVFACADELSIPYREVSK